MMLGYMHEWVEGFGQKKKSVLRRLTKESVKEHKNVLREGETGVSQALANPLGLPTLDDLKTKRPPRGVNSIVVGTHEGKPIYFSPGIYGKGGDAPFVTREIGTSSSYASPYSPSSVDSEASSQVKQRYMWTPGFSGEGEHLVSKSTDGFYSAERSISLPVTLGPYSPPPGRPQPTEALHSGRPDPRRSVTTERYAPPRWGPSQAAQDFYSSPGPTPLPFQSPVLEPLQQPGDQAPRKSFLPQGSSPQTQSSGIDFYPQNSQRGSQLSYNPYSPRTPQIFPEAASFDASPPPQPPYIGSPEPEGQVDPLAEMTANLRKF